MPRIRTVKPEYWSDEKLGQESEAVQLTYIAIWNFADDYGVVKATPLYLKSQIFPYKDKLRIDVFCTWLKRLEELEVVIPFTYRGESFYYILNFRKHQKVDKPSKARNCPERELQSALPQFFESESTPRGHSASDTVVLPEVSGMEKEVVREVGKGNGRGEEKAPPGVAFAPDRPSHAPTWQAVEECFYRLGAPDEAVGFFNYWEALHWMKGITPIMSMASFANRWLSSEIGQKTQKQAEASAAGKVVVAHFMGGEEEWTEERWQRYRNNPDSSGYTYIRHEH